MGKRAGARYFLLTGGQITVGAAAILARYALHGAGALAVSAGRLTIAAGVLLMIAFVGRIRQAQPRFEKLSVTQSANTLGVTSGETRFIFAGIALAVHFATWIWSLEYTSVAISTLLVATSPVWTSLYDAATGKRTITTVAWLAIAAGTAGTYLVVGFSRTPPPQPGHELLGAALALSGAIAIGAYFLIIREVRDAFGTRAVVTRTYSYAAVALVIAATLAHQAPPVLSDAPAWGGIVAMALVSQLMGHTAMNAALRWFSASAVAMSTLVEPIVAALLALAIFGEGLSGWAIAGAVMILGAIGVFLREESGFDKLSRASVGSFASCDRRH